MDGGMKVSCVTRQRWRWRWCAVRDEMWKCQKFRIYLL